MRLPNLLIAGVAHSGTSSLFSYLSAHPDICTSTVKETHYFYPIMAGGTLPPVQEYKRHFLHCGGQPHVLEAGPGYLYGGGELARIISKMLGSVKLIFILREPVSMLYAYFKYNNKIMQLENIPFDEFVHQAIARIGDDSYSRFEKTQDPMCLAIEGGFYSHFLKDWFAEFREEQLRVVFFDDLKDRPLEMMQGLCTWLGLDSSCYASHHFQQENKGFYFCNKRLHCLAHAVNSRCEPFFRAYPGIKQALSRLYKVNVRDNPFVLDAKSRELLENLYAPHNKELASLLWESGYRTQLPSWLRISECMANRMK